METVIEYITFVVQHYGIVMLTMIALIELILWLIKKPIKLLTNKISNERVRKLVNKVFILLSFGLAFGLYALGETLLPAYVSFETSRVFATGAFAVVFYAFGDGIVTKTSAASIAKIGDTLTSVTDSAKKGTLTKEESQSAVDSFLALCKETESTKK